jgi:hypothetical protein
MNSWPNDTAQAPWLPDSLADEVSRQLVLDFGGEVLNGSGFENDTPEPVFKTEDQAHA